MEALMGADAEARRMDSDQGRSPREAEASGTRPSGLTSLIVSVSTWESVIPSRNTPILLTCNLLRVARVQSVQRHRAGQKSSYAMGQVSTACWWFCQAQASRWFGLDDELTSLSSTHVTACEEHCIPQLLHRRAGRSWGTCRAGGNNCIQNQLSPPVTADP